MARFIPGIVLPMLLLTGSLMNSITSSMILCLLIYLMKCALYCNSADCMLISSINLVAKLYEFGPQMRLIHPNDSYYLGEYTVYLFIYACSCGFVYDYIMSVTRSASFNCV